MKRTAFRIAAALALLLCLSATSHAAMGYYTFSGVIKSGQNDVNNFIGDYYFTFGIDKDMQGYTVAPDGTVTEVQDTSSPNWTTNNMYSILVSTNFQGMWGEVSDEVHGVNSSVYVPSGTASSSLSETLYSGVTPWTSDMACDLFLQNDSKLFREWAVGDQFAATVWTLITDKLIPGIEDTIEMGEGTLTLTEIVRPTPIPGAIWLLGSGMVGLIGLRKRLIP